MDEYPWIYIYMAHIYIWAAGIHLWAGITICMRLLARWMMGTLKVNRGVHWDLKENGGSYLTPGLKLWEMQPQLQHHVSAACISIPPQPCPAGLLWLPVRLQKTYHSFAWPLIAVHCEALGSRWRTAVLLAFILRTRRVAKAQLSQIAYFLSACPVGELYKISRMQSPKCLRCYVIDW